MAITKLISVTLLFCMLSGCSVYKPKPYIPPGIFKNQYLMDITSPTLLQTYNAMPQITVADREIKALRRNQIMMELIFLIDQNYAVFENKYYGSDALVNFGGDVANLGLAGAASVTGSAHLKAVLAAISASTTGMKISYEKNFFDQQMRSTVVEKMRAGRALELATLQDSTHMRASLGVYSLETGLNDITRYYEAGTIIGALQAISISAGQDQSTAAEKQRINASQ